MKSLYHFDIVIGGLLPKNRQLRFINAISDSGLDIVTAKTPTGFVDLTAYIDRPGQVIVRGEATSKDADGLIECLRELGLYFISSSDFGYEWRLPPSGGVGGVRENYVPVTFSGGAGNGEPCIPLDRFMDVSEPAALAEIVRSAHLPTPDVPDLRLPERRTAAEPTGAEENTSEPSGVRVWTVALYYADEDRMGTTSIFTSEEEATAFRRRMEEIKPATMTRITSHTIGFDFYNLA